MKRRSFLQGLGAAVAALGLGAVVKSEPVAPSVPVKNVRYFPHGTTKARSISDVIYTIDPNDTPMLSLLGKGQKFKIVDGWPDVKVQLMGDDLNIPVGS